MKYVLHIEGMEIDLPEKTATNDTAIRTAFAEVRPEYGDAALTKISRELIPGDGVHIRFIGCTVTDGAEGVTEPITTHLAANEEVDALSNSGAAQPDAPVEITVPAMTEAPKANANDLIIDAPRSDLTGPNTETDAVHDVEPERPSAATPSVTADAIAHALMTPVEPVVLQTVAAPSVAQPDGAGDEEDDDDEEHVGQIVREPT
ncbi:MAG: hypothetical protein HC853_08340, partial [Anaerolineae bacterium]|nr:hypothetical protein [Anaerolineae bacterium]